MTKTEITMNKNIDESFYKQIFNSIKLEIASGHFPPGKKLPSLRHTALKFNISIQTALQAYNLLEENGYIEKIPGKGSFVKEHNNFSMNQGLSSIIDNFRYGQGGKHEFIDFFNGTPSSENFPSELYKQLACEVIDQFGGEIFEYQNVQGLLSLRKLLSEELEKDDIFVTEKDILITSGTQQALEIIIRAFSSERKPVVALSAPTYLNALNLFRDSCKVISVDLKHEGWDMDEFRALLQKEKIDFVYEVINFQNPTGVLWSLERRKELLRLAQKYDFYIIEDDSFREFYYTEDKPFPLKSLDRMGDERVIYLRTYSKSIMPGISTALMLPPPNFMEKILLTKYSLDTTTSGLNHKILEKFLEKGYFQKHTENLRKVFREKCFLMVELLKEIPEIEILNYPQGGFF
ncbi:MAG: PLP-dependent aminotransferase family protein, partial [Fusobacteriaceae bacterium]